MHHSAWVSGSEAGGRVCVPICVCSLVPLSQGGLPQVQLGLRPLSFHCSGGDRQLGVRSCGGRKEERPGECPGGVQSCCLPACLPHALFLEHSFQFPFLLLIVESVPGLGAARNRRKPALMEGLSSTHLSLGRRLQGPSLAPSSTLLGQQLPQPEVTFPSRQASALFSIPSISGQLLR